MEEKETRTLSHGRRGWFNWVVIDIGGRMVGAAGEEKVKNKASKT